MSIKLRKVKCGKDQAHGLKIYLAKQRRTNIRNSFPDYFYADVSFSRIKERESRLIGNVGRKIR